MVTTAHDPRELVLSVVLWPDEADEEAAGRVTAGHDPPELGVSVVLWPDDADDEAPGTSWRRATGALLRLHNTQKFVHIE